MGLQTPIIIYQANVSICAYLQYFFFIKTKWIMFDVEDLLMGLPLQGKIGTWLIQKTYYHIID